MFVPTDERDSSSSRKDLELKASWGKEESRIVRANFVLETWWEDGQSREDQRTQVCGNSNAQGKKSGRYGISGSNAKANEGKYHGVVCVLVDPLRVTHIHILLPYLKNSRRHRWRRSISWELEPKRQRKRNRHEKQLKWDWNGRKRSKWHTREVDFNSTKSFDWSMSRDSHRQCARHAAWKTWTNSLKYQKLCLKRVLHILIYTR